MSVWLLSLHPCSFRITHSCLAKKTTFTAWIHYKQAICPYLTLFAL
jgi:hypothetical protein